MDASSRQLANRLANALLQRIVQSGWAVEVHLDNGVRHRKGHQLQTVPRCSLVAISPDGKRCRASVADFDPDAAETEAARELARSVGVLPNRTKVDEPDRSHARKRRKASSKIPLPEPAPPPTTSAHLPSLPAGLPEVLSRSRLLALQAVEARRVSASVVYQSARLRQRGRRTVAESRRLVEEIRQLEAKLKALYLNNQPQARKGPNGGPPACPPEPPSA